MSDAPSRATTASAGWLAAGLHVVFLSLVVISVARVETPAAVVSGVVLGAWYVVGVALRSRSGERLGAIRLLMLTLSWAGVSLFVAVDFVWVAFPLFFLYLFLLPIRAGLVGVLVVTAVAIGALAADDGVEIGEIVGPAVGAVVAAVSAMSYRALSEEHERTRQLVAELEATRGLLSDAERERGALDERRRLAREVHDTIAQGLSSIILLTRAAELTPGDERERLGEIGDIAQTNLDEARRIVAALAPPELDDAPLPEAVEGVARRMSESTDVDVRFHLVGDPVRLSLDCEVALFRITQGALANVVTHSGAEHADVWLRYEPGSVSLEIADDGLGFDPSVLTRRTSSGFGLSVMEDRVRAVRGTLTVETEPGSGTVITVTIPRSPE